MSRQVKSFRAKLKCQAQESGVVESPRRAVGRGEMSLDLSFREAHPM